jgi:hypothetical protein
VFRLLNARTPGTGELAWTERAYEGDALRLRRLLELRRRAEYGRAAAWSAFFMALPGLVWMLGNLATMGSGTFWQVAPAVLSAMLLGPAAGLVTTGLFAFDGDEVVCVACSAPAPIEAGDRCGACSADLIRIEMRSIGRRVRRPRLLISGLLILAAATVLLVVASRQFHPRLTCSPLPEHPGRPTLLP